MTVEQALAALGAVGTIGGAVGAVYGGARTGLGLVGLLPHSRRRRLAAALRRLDVGQTLQTFSEQLGRQPARVVRDSAGLLHTFELGVVDVTARTDDDSAVVEFTVSGGQHGRFHPRINLTPSSGSPLVVRLGLTRFADLGEPVAISGFLGANELDYCELHYQGRPGGYRYFRFGACYGPTEFYDMLRTGTFTHADRDPFLDAPSALANATVRRARAATPITRYGVLATVHEDTSWVG